MADGMNASVGDPIIDRPDLGPGSFEVYAVDDPTALYTGTVAAEGGIANTQVEVRHVGHDPGELRRWTDQFSTTAAGK